MADKKQKINKKMTFAEIMQKHPGAQDILLKKGMHCIGCPISQMESLEDGCKAHGIDPEKVVEELNKKLDK